MPSKLRNNFTPPPEIRRQIRFGPILNGSRAADFLKISFSELKCRADDGIYPFYKDKKGWRWYSENELRELSTMEFEPVKKKRGRPRMQEPPPEQNVDRSAIALKPNLTHDQHEYSGLEAQRVFAELERGRRPISIVIDLSMHPDIVADIAKAYERMSETLTLDREQKRAIEKLPLQGELPILDGQHLVQILTRSLQAPNPCARCGNAKARICASCANIPSTLEVSRQGAA